MTKRSRLGLVVGLIPLTSTILHAQTQPSTGTPIVYRAVVDQTQAAAAAAAKKKESGEKKDAAMEQMMKALGGGGGPGGGANARRLNPRAEGESGEVGSGGMIGVAGSGKLEACGSLSPQIERAKAELMAFKAACPLTKSGGNGKFAINDYSSSAGIPRMYLFNADGICAKSTSVSYGSGGQRASADGKPSACADANSHLTPPGFHVTVKHDGATYNSGNSMGLAGLEGQNSQSRAILIHGSNNPGAGVSWGCSGVGHQSLSAVMGFLGYGALVYNNFDRAQMSPNCRSTAGFSHSTSCRMDPGASVPGGGGSGSGGGSGDGSTSR